MTLEHAHDYRDLAGSWDASLLRLAEGLHSSAGFMRGGADFGSPKLELGTSYVTKVHYLEVPRLAGPQRSALS